MPRITSNPPIVPVRSTEIEETAGKPGTIDTAPTAPVQPGTSSDKHIESGIRKLEETGIEQSILRANGSKGLHLVPRFDPSRLVAEIRPDRRNGRERFFDNWFGPKYLNEVERRNFELDDRDPVIARALAGKLSLYDTVRVLDRIRELTLFGSLQQQKAGRDLQHRFAIAFMTGRKLPFWKHFSSEARAARMLGRYYQTLTRDLSDRYARSGGNDGFGTRFISQTTIADRLGMYHASDKGRSLLTRLLGTGAASELGSSDFREVLLAGWNARATRQKSIHETIRQSLDDRLAEAFRATPQKTEISPLALCLTLNKANRLSCVAREPSEQQYCERVIDSMRRDKEKAPLVEAYCRQRLLLILDPPGKPGASIWDGVPIETILSRPVLATVVLPLLEEGDRETLAALQRSIIERFGSGGGAHLVEAGRLAKKWREE